MNQRYNLLDEPWLPVRLSDGSMTVVGLLEALRRCDEIVALAETAPTSLIGEHRLLLAIVHRGLARACGPWKDTQRAAWFADGLPVERLCDYLEAWRHRFWLFDEEQPFLQVAALASAEETRDKRKPWTQISLASANGNTPVVFDHAVDAMPTTITGREAVAHLLGFLQFTPGGLVKSLRDADKAGALVNTAAVLPIGRTLAETLCLALHPSPLPGRDEVDLPAWERPPLTLADLRGEPVLASGPNDRYTRQSRAVLLVPELDGRVQWIHFAAGWALGEDPQAPEPMACFRAGTNGLVRVSFLEGRALWRDLPALVPAPHIEAGKAGQAAATVQWAAGLRMRMSEGATGYQPLLIAGLASDQAKLLRWRMEQFSLPQPLLVDPERARELHAQVALAEEVHRQLRQVAVDLLAATLPNPDNKETRSRARDLIDRGPLSQVYFATAERELGAAMDLIAQDRSEEVDLHWQGALNRAARQAWDQLLNTLGMSPRALKAEARHGLRLGFLLRKLLPAVFSPVAQHETQPTEA